jgi:hypothetical protein
MLDGLETRKRRLCSAEMRDYASILRAVAERAPTAVLSTGARVLDTSDFRAWLIELADMAEKAETLEQFFSRLHEAE